MLDKAQAKYIEKSFNTFIENLSEDQLEELYFRFDDLLQYGHNSLYLAYNVIARVWAARRRSQLEHTAYHVIKGD